MRNWKLRWLILLWTGVGLVLGAFIILFILRGWDWFPEAYSFDFQTFGIWMTPPFTALGLIAVAIITRKQTDKQIDNQNKQMHRPYLWTDIVMRVDNDEYDFVPSYIKNIKSKMRAFDLLRDAEEYCLLSDGYINKIRKEVDDYQRLQRDFLVFKINVINSGAKIATKIRLYDITCGMFLRYLNIDAAEGNFGEDIGRYTYSTDNIDNGEDDEFLLPCNFYFDESGHRLVITRDECTRALLIYLDINGNNYYTMIEFRVIESMGAVNLKQPYTRVINSESSDFRQILTDNNTSIEEIVEKYKEN